MLSSEILIEWEALIVVERMRGKFLFSALRNKSNEEVTEEVNSNENNDDDMKAENIESTKKKNSFHKKRKPGSEAF